MGEIPTLGTEIPGLTRFDTRHDSVAEAAGGRQSTGCEQAEAHGLEWVMAGGWVSPQAGWAGQNVSQENYIFVPEDRPESVPESV